MGNWGIFCYNTCMDHQEYMQWLRHHSPSSQGFDIQSRPYKNSEGVEELIFMHHNYWEYVDWLEQNSDIDFADWVVHSCKNPCEGYTLSHLLMYWLWFDECGRFRQGLPTPHSYPPRGYKGWGDEDKTA